MAGRVKDFQAAGDVVLV
jgi:hypothetical protein